jgi:hypothetical protein
MNSGWWYRLAGVGGTLVLVVVAVVFANQPPVQSIVSLLPVIGSLAMDTATGSELVFEAGTTAIVVSVMLIPLFKPRPRRILDTVTGTVRALLVVTAVLATVGYFDYTLRLPRAALLSTVGILSVTLPVWFAALQHWQLKRSGGTLVVGNNPQRIEAAVQAAAEPIVGYAFSPTVARDPASDDGVGADGGHAHYEQQY